VIQGYSDLLHGGIQFLFGQVALPKDNDLPTGEHQFIIDPCVPSSIPFYLVLPEVGIGLRQDKLLASLVTVPETTVDEYCRSVFAHYDVRLAGHALDIEPVAVSVRPQPFPNQYLRFGRLAADMRHAAVALCGCQDIGHSFNFSGCSEIPNYHSVFNFEPVGVSDKLSRSEIPNN